MTPFQVLKMAGKAAPQVNIFDTNATDNNAPGTASYQLQSGGQGSRTISHSSSSLWTWLLSGLNTDYQVRTTLTSGDTPTGDALSSWLSLGTTRTWTLSVGGAGGFKEGFLTIEIRRVSDFVVIDTANVDISVG